LFFDELWHRFYLLFDTILASIFVIFGNWFFDVFLDCNFIDFWTKCDPNLSEVMSPFRHFFYLVPQEVSLKVSWLTLAPFWFNFDSILVASGALLVPFRINLVSPPPFPHPSPRNTCR
jgi:hypothetical protein